MGRLQQYFTAAACSFGSFIMGLLNVWPSYTLSIYTAANNTVLKEPMTSLEESLVGSLPSLGAMIGTGVAGLIINKVGRRNGGVLLSLPFVLSWAIIDQTSTTIIILIARFLGGISGGAFLVFAPMFISEIAEDSIRGRLASGPVGFFALGSLTSYLLGWFFTYRPIIWANIALSVLCVVLSMLVIESPLYLLRQNREQDAKNALARYRGASPDSKVVLEELNRLKVKITPAVELLPLNDETTDQKTDEEEKEEKEKQEPEKEKLNGDVEASVDRKMSPLKQLFSSPASRRAFVVVGTALTLQVFMGMVPVMVYAKNLFAEAAPNLSSHFCSVLFGMVLTSGSVVTASIADKAGRRFLIITSSAMVSVCMSSLAFLLQTGLLPPWVSAVIVLVYCFSFSCGAGTVPYLLLAEVFVPEVQGFASMLLVEWIWFTNFLIIAIFPPISKLIGIFGVFYVFAIVAIFNAVISYFSVPETKGLSNEQIQEAFLRRRKK